MKRTEANKRLQKNELYDYCGDIKRGKRFADISETFLGCCKKCAKQASFTYIIF